jgi:biopolymer transport protein TolR
MGMNVGASGGRKGRAAPEMNVTPLVDVVLVLLIIFMVITPMLAKQFWIALPDKKEEHEPPPPSDAKDSIVVTVTREGQLRINRDLVPDADFPTRLRRALAASGERTVFFDAHDDAPFGRASQALDMARGAGAATIAVSTEPLVKN